MRKRKRQGVKKLIQCAAIIAAGVLAIILFMLAIWYRGKNSEPVTDEQVAAQMQQAEPLVIETPEAATEGSIRVYDYDGCCIYSYYGKIRINSDGKDGKDIDVEAIGYLEGYAKTGETTGKGVFTIVEVKAGQGASVGWGRLKSGAGWISLDYATRLA